MKIQCDVCNKDEATMYCVADEAALCEACDHRVHHANKLAGKHQRFSLIQPSSKQAPLCDICQERKAFLFCQQDRAILCKECDIPIHKANEHTQKHNRYLLTGVKLSATATLYSSSTSPTSSSANSDVVPKTSTKKPVSVSVLPTISVQPAVVNNNKGDGIGQVMNGSTSSISEYLMETLPGWHVDDLFDAYSLNGFSKASDNDVQQFWEADTWKNMYSISSENTSLRVPQVPPPVLSTPTQSYPYGNINFGDQIGFKESMNFKSNRKWNDDNSFAVPQICPPSKRSRTLW